MKNTPGCKIYVIMDEELSQLHTSKVKGKTTSGAKIRQLKINLCQTMSKATIYQKCMRKWPFCLSRTITSLVMMIFNVIFLVYDMPQPCCFLFLIINRHLHFLCCLLQYLFSYPCKFHLCVLLCGP